MTERCGFSMLMERYVVNGRRILAVQNLTAARPDVDKIGCNRLPGMIEHPTPFNEGGEEVGADGKPAEVMASPVVQEAYLGSFGEKAA